MTLLNKCSFKNISAFISTVNQTFVNFRESNLFKKVNKTISLLRKLQNNLPRAPLVTIYKSLLRPHLDFGCIIYIQTFNNSFHEGVESIQDNATLTITGAIRGSFRENLYQELRF